MTAVLWMCQESSTASRLSLTGSILEARQIQVILTNSASSTPSDSLTLATSPSTTQKSEPSSNSQSFSSPTLGNRNLSKGAIAGIVVGVVGALLLALAALLFMRRRRQQRHGVLPTSGTGSFNWSALPELVAKRNAKGSSSAEMSMAHPNDDVSKPVPARMD
jgi:hypothetical protein